MSVPSLYIQSNGWMGCIVVVAFDEDEARDLMKDELNYDPKNTLMRFDLLTVGLKYVNTGDL